MPDKQPIADFRTKAGFAFSGLSQNSLNLLYQELYRDYGLSQDIIAEAASYSMAMVVRFALGLSADGGRTCAIVKDSMAGVVALATLRHLVNAGAEAQALVISENSSLSPEMLRQLTALKKLGVTLPDPGIESEMDGFTAFLGKAHNIIFGVYSPGQPSDEFLGGISELLNEERTPVHCIEAPPGLDVETGVAAPSALYASSTLSLGAPLIGLNKGKDYVGRHYVCDVSFSRSMYERFGLNLTSLFSDQPVIQIFPVSADAEATA